MFNLDLEKAEEVARNQIAKIRWIIKKLTEFQKNIYFCFIEYTKSLFCSWYFMSSTKDVLLICAASLILDITFIIDLH